MSSAALIGALFCIGGGCAVLKWPRLMRVKVRSVDDRTESQVEAIQHRDAAILGPSMIVVGLVLFNMAVDL